MEQKRRICYAILASGDFPSSEVVCRALLDSDKIVCCDGAVEGLLKCGREPDYIVGDLDSISTEHLDRFRAIVHHSSDQETNDLTKAFKAVLELVNGMDREEFSIVIYGATGKREDHTLGNISLLLDYDESANVSMVSDYGRFSVINDSCSFSVQRGQPVSLFAEDPQLRIVSEGLEYKTDNVIFNAWWKATLNIASSDIVSLTFNHRAKVLLYIGY